MLDLFRLIRIGIAVWGYLLWLLLRRLHLWPRLLTMFAIGVLLLGLSLRRLRRHLV